MPQEFIGWHKIAFAIFFFFQLLDQLLQTKKPDPGLKSVLISQSRGLILVHSEAREKLRVAKLTFQNEQ